VIILIKDITVGYFVVDVFNVDFVVHNFLSIVNGP